ncbi:MAG: 2-polyprenyl-3-methyl-6-methoxy-1,4-benzoquinone monooxygenase [Panacagrimonas sp.]
MSSKRHYSGADRLLMGLGESLAGLRGRAHAAPKLPVRQTRPATLVDADRRAAANLMRVNHAGEVAAQGLYHGQALTARSEDTRRHLLAAADEEQQHLEWCEQRLKELEDRPSRLRPLWYGASFAMGAAAGIFGDRWSLGFVAETERQVSEHLDEHIQRLPAKDERSREVLRAMQHDEQRHGREAESRGGVPLPEPVRGLMRRVAGVMKAGAYRL